VYNPGIGMLNACDDRVNGRTPSRKTGHKFLGNVALDKEIAVRSQTPQSSTWACSTLSPRLVGLRSSLRIKNTKRKFLDSIMEINVRLLSTV